MLPPDQVQFTDAAGRRWIRTQSGRLLRRGVPLTARLSSAAYPARHPIAMIKMVVPARYPQPDDISPQVRAEAIRIAIWQGHAERRAESALDKYASGRRLRLGEMLALESAMRLSGDLRSYGRRVNDPGAPIWKSRLPPGLPERRREPRESLEAKYFELLAKAVDSSD
jgi:hypothetical protein